MRAFLLIGVLIAMAIVAYLQLKATHSATGGAGQSPTEAAQSQTEEIERRFKQAEEKHKQKLEDAGR